MLLKFQVNSEGTCQEDSMGRGAWQTTVHGVAKSWTNDKEY